MNAIFGFGERLDTYEVPVLNEREVRASAGILFFFAMMSFMNAWLVGDFRLTRIFVIAFLIDFSIRIFVNPKFSPSMILGRFAVRRQLPEYVGAPQKRFAWGIGLVLAGTMFYLVVLREVVGPINLFVCLACLTLMFFESALGICLGCKVYNLFYKEQARLCPGGICEVADGKGGPKIGLAQAGIVLAFLAAIAVVSDRFAAPGDALRAELSASSTVRGKDACAPPDWAVAMGHADKWKLHNNCT
jgi:hypothetical protein